MPRSETAAGDLCSSADRISVRFPGIAVPKTVLGNSGGKNCRSSNTDAAVRRNDRILYHVHNCTTGIRIFIALADDYGNTDKKPAERVIIRK